MKGMNDALLNHMLKDYEKAKREMEKSEEITSDLIGWMKIKNKEVRK